MPDTNLIASRMPDADDLRSRFLKIHFLNRVCFVDSDGPGWLTVTSFLVVIRWLRESNGLVVFPILLNLRLRFLSFFPRNRCSELHLRASEVLSLIHGDCHPSF